MCVDLSEITWEAVAAGATLLAVLVALWPIVRDAKRRKAHAKSLRIRLCSKLYTLGPSLRKIGRPDLPAHPATILSKDEFREAVRSIGAMMRESSVLQSEEQDYLGMAFANLESLSPLYGTSELRNDIAEAVLGLIQQAVSVMEKNGLLNGAVRKPWEGQVEYRPKK
jgi:hypothetical protein